MPQWGRRRGRNASFDPCTNPHCDGWAWSWRKRTHCTCGSPLRTYGSESPALSTGAVQAPVLSKPCEAVSDEDRAVLQGLASDSSMAGVVAILTKMVPQAFEPPPKASDPWKASSVALKNAQKKVGAAENAAHEASKRLEDLKAKLVKAEEASRYTSEELRKAIEERDKRQEEHRKFEQATLLPAETQAEQTAGDTMPATASAFEQGVRYHLQRSKQASEYIQAHGASRKNRRTAEGEDVAMATTAASDIEGAKAELDFHHGRLQTLRGAKEMSADQHKHLQELVDQAIADASTLAKAMLDASASG